VQLLSPSLHSQLFPGSALPKPPAELLAISKQHLEQNGLLPEAAAVLDELSFDMPPLRGSNIRDHFHALGKQTAEPYLSMAIEFANAELPPKPTTWEMSRAGWTKYSADGTMEPVDDLGDETLVSFDVETLYKLSSYPCMATAVTPNGWYSWLNPSIFHDSPSGPSPTQMPWDTSTPPQYPHDLIPLFPPGSDLPRLVIGHNVGYDRARVFEEYDLRRTSTRWLDTLSFHVATRGITSVQRPTWMKHRKNKKETLEREAEVIDYLLQEAEADGDIDLLEPLAESAAEVEAMQKSWEDVTAMNSLAEVASLHCGYSVDKSIRNRFADESITHASQLRPELHDLLIYCGSDVKITHDVFTKVLPLFLDSCPHPASFAGILTMGSSFLPVNESWQEYLENAESKYREMNEGVKEALRVLAEKARKAGKQDDPWSQQLDWTEKTARWGDNFDPTLPEASTSSATATATATAEILEPTTPESPADSTETTLAWLAPYRKDPKEIVSNRSIRYTVPLLLRLTYKSHPVVHLSDHLWCFYVPHSQMSAYVDAHGAPVDLSSSSSDAKLEHLLEEHVFFRIAGPEDARRSKLTGAGVKALVKKGELKSEGYQDLLVTMTGRGSGYEAELAKCVDDMLKRGQEDPWGSQLDWTSTSLLNCS
jgi:DNA polymerase gamma 1